MCKKGDYFWMAPQADGPVIKWNPLSGDCYEIGNYPDGFRGNGFCFTKIYRCDDKLYLIPTKANMGIMIPSDSDELKPIDIPELSDNVLTSFMFQLDHYLYLSIKKDGIEKGIKLNMSNNEVESYEFIFSDNQALFKKEYGEKLLGKVGIIEENHNWELEDFISGICNL